MSNSQSQAIGNLNTIASLAERTILLANEIASCENAWSDDQSLVTAQAMQTRVLSSDGSLGSVDQSPNNAHPIDNIQFPTLDRAASINAYSTALSNLINIKNCILNGGAISATPGLRSVLGQLIEP